MAGYAHRAGWVAQLGGVFEAHRTTSAILVLVNVLLGYQLWQLGEAGVRRLVAATGAVFGLEVLAGITLAAAGLPAWVQPVHLTLATLLFGTQFLTWLAVRRPVRVRRVAAPASPGTLQAAR